MPSRPISRLLLAGALGAVLALPVGALAGGGKHMSPACRSDAERLCPDAEGGCARKQCLKEHRGDLSADCSADLVARKQQRAAVRVACIDDMRRLCGEIDSRWEARKCLRTHRDQLSPPCNEALQAVRQARHDVES